MVLIIGLALVQALVQVVTALALMGLVPLLKILY
jgi:hypothetical protein